MAQVAGMIPYAAAALQGVILEGQHQPIRLSYAWDRAPSRAAAIPAAAAAPVPEALQVHYLKMQMLTWRSQSRFLKCEDLVVDGVKRGVGKGPANGMKGPSQGCYDLLLRTVGLPSYPLGHKLGPSLYAGRTGRRHAVFEHLAFCFTKAGYAHRSDEPMLLVDMLKQQYPH